MLYRLQRHPIAVKAHFEFSLVLAYAFPREVLQPLLPPGLELDTYGDLGFLAIAMVQTRGLRPAFVPRFLAQNFFLSGYRIFVRFRGTNEKTQRGLRILRSDTNRPLMAFFGNRLTHYNYHLAKVDCTRDAGKLTLDIRSPAGVADLSVIAHIGQPATELPAGSPFPDFAAARKFAGPLPYTFDYEPQTHSIIKIKGVREDWNPMPVRVDVGSVGFFRSPPFNQIAHPQLANAFYLENVPYRWKRGEREQLARD